MVFALIVCLKAIFHHENIDLHPTCTDFAAQIGRKGSGHPVEVRALPVFTLVFIIMRSLNLHKALVSQSLDVWHRYSNPLQVQMPQRGFNYTRYSPNYPPRSIQ